MFRNSNFSSLNFSSSSASLILEAASSRTDAKNSVMAFSPSSESSLALFANGTPTSSLSAKPYYQGRQIVLEPDPPCSIGCVILITCTHRRVWYTPCSGSSYREVWLPQDSRNSWEPEQAHYMDPPVCAGDEKQCCKVS